MDFLYSLPRILAQNTDSVTTYSLKKYRWLLSATTGVCILKEAISTVGDRKAINGRIMAAGNLRCSVYARFPVDSMRLATFTVSPKRQYLGIVTPTTPPTTDPLCRPQRIINLRFGRWAIYGYQQIWTESRYMKITKVLLNRLTLFNIMWRNTTRNCVCDRHRAHASSSKCLQCAVKLAPYK